MRLSLHVPLCLTLIGCLAATETENQVLPIIPAPGPVTTDGGIDDWDLRGGIFCVNDVENLRDSYGVWFHAMHDAERLYLLARWNDPIPLDNPGSSVGDQPWQGDCLQVRFIAGYRTEQEKVTHWSCWRDRNGIDVLNVSFGRTFKEGSLRDAQDQGAQQEFHIADDRTRYTQEIAIPWTLITKDGKPPANGELRVALEPNYTAGAMGRVSIKDIFRPDLVPDRVFTFRAYDQWGAGTILSDPLAKPQDLRLADGRTFPVLMEEGRPRVDWTGLVATREIAGFKEIRYTVPEDGYVSLNLVRADGSVARQLLTSAFVTKGEHQVRWDGLTTPYLTEPGEVVEPGTYAVKAIWHPGIGLRLRGWASNAGRVPWDAGPTSNWGGDHGFPEACATDGKQIYLGWGGAEAGKALLACDQEGNVRWKHLRGGLGGAGKVAVDAGSVFVVDHNTVLYRLDAKTGSYANFSGSKAAEIPVAKLWGEQPLRMPTRVEGMDAAAGRILVTCASVGFLRADVADWRAMLAKVVAGTGLASRIRDRLSDHWKKTGEKLTAADDLDVFCKSPNYYTPDFRDDVIKALNKLLSATDLPGVDAGLSGVRLQQANRQAIEAALPGDLAPTRSNFLAILDGKTGLAKSFIDLPQPSAVHATDDGRALVVTEGGAALVEVRLDDGAVRPITEGWSGLRGVTLDGAGRILLAVAGERHQVVILDPEGKEIGAIGRPGGRPETGPWVSDGLRNPVGITVDAAGRVWVAESHGSPKRISVWNPTDGSLVKEFFGPTHYGASGGAIHPHDPNLMFGQGCEWRLDPDTGRATCLGGVGDEPADGSIYAEAGGRVYLAIGRSRGRSIRIFERLGDGDFRLRASISCHGDGSKTQTRLWADADGDQEVDEDEVVTKPEQYRFWPYGWEANVNEDLSICTWVPSAKAGTILNVTGFTACNAPIYDPDAALAAVRLPGIGGNRACPKKRTVLDVSQKFLTCASLPDGRTLWTYPNTFSGVHGSHYATPPEPGLLRGAFGIVGTARLPGPLGTIWVLNGNCGEWYMFNEDGFFVTQLFQGDPFKQRFPENAVPGAVLDAAPPGLGGEDFGGHLRQGSDGKVYIQAGKTALWNVEVVGLEKVRALDLPPVSITTGDLATARTFREQLLQAASDKIFTIPRRPRPAFTGSLEADWKGIKPITFEKQPGSRVRAALSWDESGLHVGWEVQDETPWINGADAPAYLYARGDTVDLQIGADPDADAKREDPVLGDLRLSIGPFQGKPAAVIYRKVSATKAPMTFSSGVIAEYVVDQVEILDGLDIVVTVDAPKRRYVVETVIPFAALGINPRKGLSLRGDVGATHGDKSGTDTALRSHWSNQQTGLVNDEVFELMMRPGNWGVLRFADE